MTPEARNSLTHKHSHNSTYSIPSPPETKAIIRPYVSAWSCIATGHCGLHACWISMPSCQRWWTEMGGLSESRSQICLGAPWPYRSHALTHSGTHTRTHTQTHIYACIHHIHSCFSTNKEAHTLKEALEAIHCFLPYRADRNAGIMRKCSPSGFGWGTKGLICVWMLQGKGCFFMICLTLFSNSFSKPGAGTHSRTRRCDLRDD